VLKNHLQQAALSNRRLLQLTFHSNEMMKHYITEKHANAAARHWQHLLLYLMCLAVIK